MSGRVGATTEEAGGGEVCSEPTSACPICMEDGGTVALCPRAERPCAARYHPACAETFRKHGEDRGGRPKCPTCRASPPAPPQAARPPDVPPGSRRSPPPDSYIVNGSCAGFALCYAMALSMLLMAYFASGLLIGAIIRLLYGDPEGVTLQRHRVYLNGSAAFEVRLEDIADEERKWVKTMRRLRIDPTTHLRATDVHSQGVYELRGEAQTRPNGRSHAADRVDYVRVVVAAPPNPSRVLEVRHVLETPSYATDPLSAAFFDQSAYGFLLGAGLYGWKRLLERSTSDYDSD